MLRSNLYGMLRVPGGGGIPVPLGVLEVAVLNQLCVEAPVRAVVDILEEDAYQLVADGLGGGSVDGDCCLQLAVLQAGKTRGVVGQRLAVLTTSLGCGLLKVLHGHDLSEADAVHASAELPSVHHSLLVVAALAVVEALLHSLAAGYVGIVLRFPVDEVGRGGHGVLVRLVVDLEGELPRAVGQSRQYGAVHLFLSAPGAVVALDKRGSIGHRSPRTSVGRIGEGEAAGGINIVGEEVDGVGLVGTQRERDSQGQCHKRSQELHRVVGVRGLRVRDFEISRFRS